MFTVSQGYFNFECLNLLQHDFCKQRYITLNATISGQDRIYPKTHLCRTFLAEYTNDFSTLYNTLPHDLIKNQLVDLIENKFRHDEVLYLAWSEE